MGLVLAQPDTVRCSEMRGHSVPQGFPSAFQCSRSDSQLLQLDNPQRRRTELVMRIWARHAAVVLEALNRKHCFFFSYWQNALHLMRSSSSAGLWWVPACQIPGRKGGQSSQVTEQVLAVVVFARIITGNLNSMYLKFKSPCKCWFCLCKGGKHGSWSTIQLSVIGCNTAYYIYTGPALLDLYWLCNILATLWAKGAACL